MECRRLKIPACDGHRSGLRVHTRRCLPVYGLLGLGSGCAAAMSCRRRLHGARGHGGPTRRDSRTARRVRCAPRRLAIMVRDPPAGGEAGLHGISPIECPSVVTLRGGTSQAHDSAGGLCYGDGRMRFLLMWLAPHLQQSRDEEKAPIFTGLRGRCASTYDL